MNKQLLFVAALGLLACGPELDRSSELKTLRVLGIHKSAAYAQPGEELALSMLWHDGRTREDATAPDRVSVAWFSFCFNPGADQYYGCFDSLSGGQGSPPGGEPQQLELPPAGSRACLPGTSTENSVCVGSGDRFSFTMPADIISSRPPPPDPSQPPYGLSFVFFTACAGELATSTPSEENPFPFVCRDADGAQLGADDFVAGYTAVYAYENLRNNTPIIEGFAVKGVSVTPDCIGPDCLDKPVVVSADCSPDAVVIPVCTEDDDDDCPGHDIRPLVPDTSVDPDQLSADTRGRDLTEQMWINYYTDRGSVKSDARLFNDAVAGVNRNYGTEYRAPKEPGPATVWAVVHDNRGAMNWVREELCIQ